MEVRLQNGRANMSTLPMEVLLFYNVANIRLNTNIIDTMS